MAVNLELWLTASPSKRVKIRRMRYMEKLDPGECGKKNNQENLEILGEG